MHPDRNTPKPNRWEYGLPALACVSLIVACILVSARKLYWNDEFYSYYFLSDPSFAGMLASFHDKLNNTPILYFALGWVWDKIFGPAELSLRLFSSLGICLALVLAWMTLRRTYSFLAVSLGTLAVFGTSSVILEQNAEARMYGLFLTLCAGAYLLYDKLCRDPVPRSNLLWLNAAVHICIVHTHLFGGFYSGAILVSIFLADRYHRLFRPRVYLSVVFSWLSIIFYIPSFLVQADAGKPRTWLPTPDLMDLGDVLNLTASPFFWRPVLLLPLVLLGLYLVGRRRTRTRPPGPGGSFLTAPDISNLVFAAVFLALPVFIWLFSVTMKPIFLDRYMIPTTLGWAILFAAILHRILPAFALNATSYKQPAPFGRSIAVPATICTLGALAFFLVRPVHLAVKFPTGKIGEDLVERSAYSDLPIVLSTSHAFMQHLYYAPDPERYYFILDREAALNEHSGTFTPQEFKHMEAWKRRYPQQFRNVLETEDFTGRHDRFLVLGLPDPMRKCPPGSNGLRQVWDVLQCPQWVNMRLLHDRAYDVTVPEGDGRFSVLLVERRSEQTGLAGSWE